MSNIINNIDLDKIQKTIESGRKDRQFLKKPIKLEGEWNFDIQKGYQFKTELAYEKGKEVIEIDSPSFLGGGGNRLGPMGYCVAGITSCFITTFVSILSSHGIKLNKLRINAECNINFAKTFDISDEPITEGINFEIDIEKNEDEGDNTANDQKLQQLITMAEERCPAIYSMSHIIKVSAKLK
ncbi:OsmC family protein [Candidatus Nitrosocosmicus arcticus]|uniref:Putative redox protein regulator of disulfide bond formation n=1 Tax=Candidatus Nitrosocosmicus arcticus TaxID=2035267 RepID=A0A557SWQ3_9ARCH|nr:OsmC family protein [Candidatus Nitrosocosmicus arcticus]TVP41038.1 putative redox protein regulator of disulfide bond formation [Candidatus Nitrosocosmicus arcticus]